MWRLALLLTYVTLPQCDGDGYTSKPAAPESLFELGIPPLPVLDELHNVKEFITHSLDDAIEDIAKLLALYFLTAWLGDAVWTFICSRTTSRAQPKGRRPPRPKKMDFMRLSFRLLVFSVVYAPCDHLSDALADYIDSKLLDAARWLGMDVQQHVKATGSAHHASSAIDDLTEDAFKGVCLYAHASVGALLSSKYLGARIFSRLGVFGSIIDKGLGFAISLGVPASRYTDCNRYGDGLGDLVHRAVFGPGNQTSA